MTKNNHNPVYKKKKTKKKNNHKPETIGTKKRARKRVIQIAIFFFWSVQIAILPPLLYNIFHWASTDGLCLQIDYGPEVNA